MVRWMSIIHHQFYWPTTWSWSWASGIRKTFQCWQLHFISSSSNYEMLSIVDLRRRCVNIWPSNGSPKHLNYFISKLKQNGDQMTCSNGSLIRRCWVRVCGDSLNFAGAQLGPGFDTLVISENHCNKFEFRKSKSQRSRYRSVSLYCHEVKRSNNSLFTFYLYLSNFHCRCYFQIIITTTPLPCG